MSRPPLKVKVPPEPLPMSIAVLVPVCVARFGGWEFLRTNLPADHLVAQEVLAAAKKSNRTLTEEEILEIVHAHDST